MATTFSTAFELQLTLNHFHTHHTICEKIKSEKSLEFSQVKHAFQRMRRPTYFFHGVHR